MANRAERAPDAGGVRAEKKRLRREMLSRRRLLDREYMTEADREIQAAFLALPAYRNARILFIYVSTDGEVDTRELIEAALRDGHRVAVPRCDAAKKGVMEACEIHALEELQPGRFGIPEPSHLCAAVPPDALDLCVVPAIAMDADGVRLGYGGGYYDRYLPYTRAVCAGLCREALLCSRLPREEHDRPMDILVTEKKVIFYENAGRSQAFPQKWV